MFAAIKYLLMQCNLPSLAHLSVRLVFALFLSPPLSIYQLPNIFTLFLLNVSQITLQRFVTFFLRPVFSPPLAYYIFLSTVAHERKQIVFTKYPSVTQNFRRAVPLIGRGRSRSLHSLSVLTAVRSKCFDFFWSRSCLPNSCP